MAGFGFPIRESHRPVGGSHEVPLIDVCDWHLRLLATMARVDRQSHQRVELAYSLTQLTEEKRS